MVARYGLNTLNLQTLTTSELTKLVTDTLEQVSRFVRINKTETLLIQQKQELEQLLTKYKAVQQINRPTNVATQLEQADIERDQAFVTLATFVKANAYIKTASIQLAYKMLHTLLKDYRKILVKSYEVESSELLKLIAKLKSETYQEAITQLGLGTHLVALEDAQNKFELLYQQRLLEQAAISPGQTKALRKEIEKGYDAVVDIIALFNHCYAQTSLYRELFGQINVIRSRYKKVKRSQKYEKDFVENQI